MVDTSTRTDPFSSAERRKASYVGEAKRRPDGTFRIEVRMLGSTTTLMLEMRPDTLLGIEGRFLVLGRFQDTPEQRDLKRRDG